MAVDSPNQGFTFPGVIEVTAMGASDAGLECVVADVLRAAAVETIDGSLRTRPSSAGRYVSVSVAFQCPDRATYDRVQRDLSANPAVRWTL